MEQRGGVEVLKEWLMVEVDCRKQREEEGPSLIIN